MKYPQYAGPTADVNYCSPGSASAATAAKPAVEAKAVAEASPGDFAAR